MGCTTEAVPPGDQGAGLLPHSPNRSSHICQSSATGNPKESGEEDEHNSRYLQVRKLLPAEGKSPANRTGEPLAASSPGDRWEHFPGKWDLGGTLLAMAAGPQGEWVGKQRQWVPAVSSKAGLGLSTGVLNTPPLKPHTQQLVRFYLLELR